MSDFKLVSFGNLKGVAVEPDGPPQKRPIFIYKLHFLIDFFAGLGPAGSDAMLKANFQLKLHFFEEILPASVESKISSVFRLIPKRVVNF